MIQQNKIVTKAQILFGGVLGGPFIGGFFLMLLLFELNKKPLAWIAWISGLLLSYIEVQWAGTQCKSSFWANIDWILLLLALHTIVFYFITFILQKEQALLIAHEYELFSWNSVITMTLISLLFHVIVIYELGRMLNPVLGVNISPYQV